MEGDLRAHENSNRKGMGGKRREGGKQEAETG